jgi:hypothetical protein
MKSLDEVQEKMAALYEQVESGAVERKVADSLANIAGKYLKAEQLKFAREVFGRKQSPPAITGTVPPDGKGVPFGLRVGEVWALPPAEAKGGTGA